MSSQRWCVFYSDHFEAKCLDASWKPHNELFYRDQPTKQSLVKDLVSPIFSYIEQVEPNQIYLILLFRSYILNQHLAIVTNFVKYYS